METIAMNPHFLELIEQATEPTGLEGIGGSYRELNPEKFARLIYKDIITVVAAQAMMGETALDVFINLERIYNDQPKSS
jgi:hypothetical protein